MKKLKMFGFTLMAMFVGIIGASALELGDTISADGKLTYTKEADETFSYQIIRVSADNWATVSSDVATMLVSVEANTAQLEQDMASYENAVKIYEKALAAYEADDSTANKTELEIAEADMNAAYSYVELSMQELRNSFNKTMNYVKQVAPVGNMTEVNDSALTGEIAIDMTGAEADDIYIVWLKSDEYKVLADDGILLGEIYTPSGQLMPTLPGDTTVPTLPDTMNNKTPNENIENPKTGVSMPIAASAGIVALAIAGTVVVSKKRLFKQL